MRISPSLRRALHLASDGIENPLPPSVLQVHPAWELRVPGGLPQRGGLLGAGFVLQTQVLDVRDKEGLPGPGRAWGPIASFFRNRNFQ